MFNTQTLTRDYPRFSCSMKVHDLTPSHVMAGAFVCSVVILLCAVDDRQHQPVCNLLRLQTHSNTDKQVINRL